jgi:hypothetical protein
MVFIFFICPRPRYKILAKEPQNLKLPGAPRKFNPALIERQKHFFVIYKLIGFNAFVFGLQIHQNQEVFVMQ